MDKSGQFLSVRSPLSEQWIIRCLGRIRGAVVDDLIGKLDDVVDGKRSDFSIALLQNANFGPKPTLGRFPGLVPNTNGQRSARTSYH
jgi:hypothetical protein